MSTPEQMRAAVAQYVEEIHRAYVAQALTFPAAVRGRMALLAPGPLTVAAVGARNLHVLATLADWTRADAAGKIVGYYGYNTLTGVPPANRSYAQQLARRVDAFFPSMYTFDDNQAAWATRAQTEAAEDRALAAGKLVFFYLWPQYHDGTPRQFQYIDASYWRFQLNTAYRDADGIVLWCPSRFPWDETSGWWTATLEFIQQIASTEPLGSAS